MDLLAIFQLGSGGHLSVVFISELSFVLLLFFLFFLYDSPINFNQRRNTVTRYLVQVNLDLEHMTIIHTSSHKQFDKVQHDRSIQILYKNSPDVKYLSEQRHSKLYFYSYSTTTLRPSWNFMQPTDLKDFKKILQPLNPNLREIEVINQTWVKHKEEHLFIISTMEKLRHLHHIYIQQNYTNADANTGYLCRDPLPSWLIASCTNHH